MSMKQQSGGGIPTKKNASLSNLELCIDNDAEFKLGDLLSGGVMMESRDNYSGEEGNELTIGEVIHVADTSHSRANTQTYQNITEDIFEMIGNADAHIIGVQQHLENNVFNDAATGHRAISQRSHDESDLGDSRGTTGNDSTNVHGFVEGGLNSSGFAIHSFEDDVNFDEGMLAAMGGTKCFPPFTARIASCSYCLKDIIPTYIFKSHEGQGNRAPLWMNMSRPRLDHPLLTHVHAIHDMDSS